MLQKDSGTPGIELNDDWDFQKLEGICQIGTGETSYCTGPQKRVPVSLLHSSPYFKDEWD